MRNCFKYLIYIFVIGLSCSCTTVLDETSPEDLKITLGIGVPGTVIMTKSGPIDYDTFLDEEISLIRWDEGDNTNPKDYPFESALAATIGEPDGMDGWKRYVNFETSQYFVDRTASVGFAACYPSVKEDDTPWSLNGNVLTYDIFDGPDTDVMVSDFKSGTYDTGIEPLQFNHALCLYNVWVYAVDEHAVETWGNFENVSFVNLPEELFVTLPEDMTAPDANVTFSFSPAPASPADYEVQTLFEHNQSIPLKVGIQNKEKVGYILGGPPAIGVLGISAKTEKQDQSTSPISIARNFQPGYVYNLVLRFSEHGVINAEVTVEEWIHDEGEFENPYYADLGNISGFLTNLSRYGTSNSYIAASGNMGYCFDATVKGNGVNSVHDWGGNTSVMPDNSVGLNTAYLQVIHSEALLKYDKTNKKYIPTTDAEKSTPLLKLRSEYLTDGYALFDIPGISEPQEGEDTDFTLPYQGNVIIAAYNSSHEVIWSWHIWVTERPYNVNYGNGYIAQDRNLGACASTAEHYSTNPEIVSGLEYQWGRKDPIFSELEPINGPVLMSEAHRNPGRAISSSTNDWMQNSYEYLWGYVAERVDVVKTIYDPCPHGYRVSDNHSFQDIQGDWEPTTDGCGYNLDVGDYTMYYPNVSMYSATPVINSKSYLFTANNGFISKEENRKSKNYVRCVVENSTPVVHRLDENQSANCHLIEEPGYYRFDAKTLGNGVRGFNVVTGGTTIEIVSIDASYDPEPVVKVDVLSWQGDLTDNSEFRQFAAGTPNSAEIEEKCPVKILDGGELTDGNAYYYISSETFEPGNVILAGYDSNDNIVWTWHVWLVPGGVKEVRWGNYMVMDRNVGATWCPSKPSDIKDYNYRSSVGFYYQWGRKDPFPMTTENSNNLYAPMFRKVDGVWSKITTLDYQTPSTIAESVSKPYVYFNASNTYYWQTSQDAGDPLRNIWGYTGVEGSVGDTFVKTMWDPCPAGYKVTSHEAVFGWNVGANTDGSNNKTADDSVYQFGAYLDSADYDTIDQVWLPITGRITQNGVLTNVNYGYLNSSCSFANGQTYRGMYYNYNLEGGIYQNYRIGQLAATNQTYAVPVRCVKE